MDVAGRFFAGLLAVVLIFLNPLQYIAQAQTEIVDEAVSVYAAEFADTARHEGKITLDAYEDLVSQIDQTGELYDIEIEVSHPVSGKEMTKKTIGDEMPVLNTENTSLRDDVDADTTFGTIDNSIDTEENEIFSLATHTHTDDCYAGHRHTVSCRSKVFDVDATIYWGTNSGQYVPDQITLTLYCANCGMFIWYYRNYMGNNAVLDIYNSSSFTPTRDGNGNIQYDYYGDMLGWWHTGIGNLASGYGYAINSEGYNAIVNTNRNIKSYLSSIGLISWTNVKSSTPDYTEYFMKDVSWNYTGGYPHGLESGSCPNCLGYSCGLIQDETLICNQVVTSIAPINPFQTVFSGSPMDTTIMATMLDGTTKPVSCSNNYNPNVVGQQTVTFTYSGLVGNAKAYSSRTCTVSVTVKPNTKQCTAGLGHPNFSCYLNACPVCTAIAGVSASNLTTNYDGTTKQLAFSNATGAQINAYYDTDPGGAVVWSMGVGPTAVGVYPVHIYAYMYNDITGTWSNWFVFERWITINRVASSITANMTKTTINKGEAFPIASITINYNNGTTSNVTSGWSVSGFNTNTAGVQNVTVSYGGLSTVVAVTVNLQLSLITISPLGQSIERYSSPYFDVKVSYTDGSSKILSNNIIHDTSNSSIGKFNNSWYDTPFSKVTLSTGETAIKILAGTGVTVISVPNVFTAGKIYTVTFDAWSTHAGDFFRVDAFPDSLPESEFRLSTNRERYSCTFYSTLTEMNAASLRMFVTAIPQGFIHFTNIKVFEYAVAGIDTKNLGDQIATISYAEHGITRTATASVTVTTLTKICGVCGAKYSLDENDADKGCPVCGATIVSIAATPSNIKLVKGSSLPITVTATYRTGKTVVVSGWTSNYVPNVVGIQEVKITYQGKETYLKVEVTDKQRTCPICTRAYNLNDDGSDPGCPICKKEIININVSEESVIIEKHQALPITVIGTFKDGHVEPITDWSSDLVSDTSGTYDVTVLYQNATDHVIVTILEEGCIQCPICGLKYSFYDSPNGCPICSVTMIGIEAALRNGGTTVMYKSQPNLQIVLLYRDTHRLITYTGWTISGYRPDVLGVQVITVHYGSYSTTMEIEVVNAHPGIVCPNGHEYYLNEDGSDPGCPYCIQDTEKENAIFLFHTTYTTDILFTLYEDSVFNLNEGDYLTVTITQKDVSIRAKLKNMFFGTNKGIANKKFTFGGEVI